MPEPSKTHYEILQVECTANPVEIRKSYLSLVKKVHPDHNPHPSAGQAFDKLQQAYLILKDPIARKEYDRQLMIDNSDEYLDNIMDLAVSCCPVF